MRISMTYGVLPRLEDFEAAFEAELGDKLFTFTFRGSDADVMDDLGLPVDGRFTARKLFKIVETLTEALHDGDEDAGDIASSILYSLGIEWI